jgi:hypothetical protein
LEPLAAVEDLRAAVADLADSDDVSARRFGERLASYAERASAGAELLECLGLASVNGETWFQVDARHQRDAALRELARFWPNKKTAGLAYEIERAAERYAASSWRFDKAREAMPAHYSGTISEWLWKAFASGAAMPLKKRRLETILSAKCNMPPVVIASDGSDDERPTIGDDHHGFAHSAAKASRAG